MFKNHPLNSIAASAVVPPSSPEGSVSPPQSGPSKPWLELSERDEAAFKLAAWKAGTTAPSQPVQVLMRFMQMHKESSMSAAYNKIVASSPTKWGIRTAFFNGVFPSTVKEGYKGLLKGYGLKLGPEIIKKNGAPLSNLPSASQHALIALGGAAIAGPGNVMLGLIPERLATYYSTRTGDRQNASFVKEISQEKTFSGKLRFLTRGGWAMTVKDSLAILAMLSISRPIQKNVNDSLDIKPGTPVSTTASFASAMSTGGVVAVVGSAVDIIKTQAQMAQSTHASSITEALKSNIKRYGIGRGLFAGIIPKFGLTAFGWTLAAACTQQEKLAPDSAWLAFDKEPESDLFKTNRGFYPQMKKEMITNEQPATKTEQVPSSKIGPKA